MSKPIILIFWKMVFSEALLGIVVSRFNSFLTTTLLDSCLKELCQNGFKSENISVVEVPGAAEIPFAARQMLQTGKYRGLITLGVIIQGETAHFDQVCNIVTSGIAQLNLTYDSPVIFGVLTTRNLAQALVRVDEKQKNSGAVFARDLITMLKINY